MKKLDCLRWPKYFPQHNSEGLPLRGSSPPQQPVWSYPYLALWNLMLSMEVYFWLHFGWCGNLWNFWPLGVVNSLCRSLSEPSTPMPSWWSSCWLWIIYFINRMPFCRWDFWKKFRNLRFHTCPPVGRDYETITQRSVAATKCRATLILRTLSVLKSHYLSLPPLLLQG